MGRVVPSLSAVANSENWMRSQQVEEAAILYPEVAEQLYERYGDENFAYDGLIESVGGKKYISNMIFRHAEKNSIHQFLNFETHSAGATNALVTLTLQSNMEYDYPESAPASPFVSTTQFTGFPVYENMIVRFPDGTMSAVGTVAGLSVNVTPMVSGENIPAVATTDNVIITGNFVGESADLNPSRDSQVIWYTNNMSNMNWSYQVNGNAKVERTWLKIEGKYVWWYGAQLDERKRAKNERTMRLLTDVKTTNLTFANTSGNETKITFEGLIPFIDNYGNQFPYDTVTNFDLSDMQNFVTGQLIPNVAAPEYAVWSAAKPTNIKDNFVMDSTKNGGIVYGSFGKDQEQYANFQFNSFSCTGHSFHWKHFDHFDHYETLGAPGQGYEFMFLFIPGNKVTTTVDWNDMTTTKTVPKFMTNYQSYDGYNREWEEIMFGGIDGVITDGKDRRIFGMRSTCGFEGIVGNTYGIGQLA